MIKFLLKRNKVLNIKPEKRTSLCSSWSTQAESKPTAALFCAVGRTSHGTSSSFRRGASLPWMDICSQDLRENVPSKARLPDLQLGIQMGGLILKSPGNQVAYSVVKSSTENLWFNAAFSIFAWYFFKNMSYVFYLKTNNKWQILGLAILKVFRPKNVSHRTQNLEKYCTFLM